MTEKQQILLNKYKERAKLIYKYIAVDSDGKIFAYKTKPQWRHFGGEWYTEDADFIKIGHNNKLRTIAKDSLQTIDSTEELNALFFDGIPEPSIKCQKDIIKKPKFNFSQDDRYEQKKHFYPGLRIHDEPFDVDNTADDLDEYLKEFSTMNTLFAIRLYKKADSDIGFQLFIEDDGNFYLWDTYTRVHYAWLFDLQQIITETMNLILLESRRLIKESTIPANF